MNREGWLTTHPTTGEPVEVVNALWLSQAKNEINAYELALAMAQYDLTKTVEALSLILARIEDANQEFVRLDIGAIARGTLVGSGQP